MGNRPWLAALLGWIPGFGHLYIGNYKKGLLIHIVALILFTSGIGLIIEPILVIYSVFSAYTEAKKMQEGIDQTD